MQTKESIIETLLENKHITVEQAVILLKDSHISYGQIRYVTPPATQILPWIQPNNPFNPNMPYTTPICNEYFTSGSTTTGSTAPVNSEFLR
jgi:hypothetical protein